MAPCVYKRQQHKKVLILGAGLSGIVAGKTLMDNGVDDFLILEGQDYIGGRIKQHNFSGFNVELGANWIHLAKQEDSAPMWSLKQQKNILGCWNQSSNFIIRNAKGADITDMESYRHWKQIETEFEAKQEERENDKKPEIPTFSTGVLASDMVTFNPPLPEWKREAILKMPLSVYTKIFIKFPYKFWDEKDYILFAGDKRGHYPVFKNLESHGMFPEGSAMLLISVTEDQGRRIEKQTFEETKTEIVETLRKVYGQDIPEPTDIFYPRWSTNPFTLGSFSEPVVGITPQDFKDLAMNLENLHFAGEALDYEWFGYMQGAYITGQRQGKMLSKLVKTKEGRETIE
ncbi:polyamine oxidase 6-like [Actinia tenebrosa]|uniref:Polyamine oxidase 6-like n=1 Tax=Actinia tenebrosa TaxID=6105 RepID=A0A6P8IYL6_ACTTE|nr:polyamine oxidase 6-like [Actinia tenebrosa]